VYAAAVKMRGDILPTRVQAASERNGRIAGSPAFCALLHYRDLRA
jgi:hypothetical protein